MENNMLRVNIFFVSEVKKALRICIGYVQQPAVLPILTTHCYVSKSLKIGSAQNSQ